MRLNEEQDGRGRVSMQAKTGDKAGLAYHGLLMPSNGARALLGDHRGTF